jgi:hypothetical protein
MGAGPLYLRERPGTHCIGGCVGHRAGLEGVENLAHIGIRTPYSPNRGESLHRPSYPDRMNTGDCARQPHVFSACSSNDTVQYRPSVLLFTLFYYYLQYSSNFVSVNALSTALPVTLYTKLFLLFKFCNQKTPYNFIKCPPFIYNQLHCLFNKLDSKNVL